MGRRGYIIVTGDHKDDGYRREDMRRRMDEADKRGSYPVSSNYHTGYPMSGYDEGYRTGYEHGYRDHERKMIGGGEYRETRYGW